MYRVTFEQRLHSSLASTADMVYLNPNGHDWGNNYNWDGLGISYLAFAVAYSLVFYAMCAVVWANRKHPVVKMRNINLAITSLLLLHVYLCMIFLAYVLNGHYPCDAEFWFMSIYLPFGIGLFQAQNQQLLLVSRAQSKLVFMEDSFKPLAPMRPLPKRWAFKLRQWWATTTEQSKYEGYVVIGIILQFVVSTVIFLISRKFVGLTAVSQHVSKGMCRRGWEWAPSIIWQFVWNWICGPILIWKIRMIRDIYHWRLQTILCIVAGIPGSPMWLAAAYSNNFAPVNKYWIPAAWFVPGLITIEMVTLGFPIYQVYHHKRAAYKTTKTIAQWELNRDVGFPFALSIISNTRSTSVSELDECLHGDFSQFLVYCCWSALTGESTKFLIRVLNFQKRWDIVFLQAGNEVDRARKAMFRAAVEIYLCMIYGPTAIEQINVEHAIYCRLDRLFKAAGILLASDRPPTPCFNGCPVAPWEEPLIDQSNDRHDRLIQMASLGRCESVDAKETQCIVDLNEVIEDDKLAGFNIPAEFGRQCFNEAYASIKAMVYNNSWQNWVNTVEKLEYDSRRSH